MILETKHFGNVEINEDDVIIFEKGIPGFENNKRYAILYKVDDDNPFKWLQSVDNGSIAFVIIDPKTFKDFYEIKIEDEVMNELEIDELSDVMVYNIVTIPEDITKITANLRAPVIINAKKNKGCQIILENGDYSFRQSILNEIHEMGGK